MEEKVQSLVLPLLKRLFGKIAEELLAKIQSFSLEQLEALALALLGLRLRSLTWKGGYKVNQKGKSHAQKESNRSFYFYIRSLII
ncbi:DUF4351 domain-containing protein [uncultured Nostoc sp.]|uniref:DUF4351 domain-containing protein n=1 Tax=uncultured Nostoc sp. TaxID=340711 RepID=UPI0035C98C9E